MASYGQDSDLGNWLIYIGNKKVKGQWNWHHEIQYRNYNVVGDLEQLLIRTGIGYNLTEDNNNVLLGYGFIRAENYRKESDTKSTVNEHRIFQQFITKQKINRVSLQHRLRFEQRFFGEAHKLRLRYFLGFGLPLNRKELIEKTFYLSAYNEVFLNIQESIFDRNRLFGGLGYKLNSKVRFELGYMNQFLSRGNRDQVNLLLLVNF